MPEYEFGVIKWSGLVHYFRDIEGNQYLENSHVTPLLKTLGELGWELVSVLQPAGYPDPVQREYFLQRQKPGISLATTSFNASSEKVLPTAKQPSLIEYIRQRTDAQEFSKLVDELTDMLYVGFEAGGAPGNLQQLGQLMQFPEYAVEKDWLVIVDKAALRRSIEQIFDAKL